MVQDTASDFTNNIAAVVIANTEVRCTEVPARCMSDLRYSPVQDGLGPYRKHRQVVSRLQGMAQAHHREIRIKLRGEELSGAGDSDNIFGVTVMEGASERGESVVMLVGRDIVLSTSLVSRFLPTSLTACSISNALHEFHRLRFL